jgi:sensor histidine kinase regulating citrate/malate metabolism
VVVHRKDAFPGELAFDGGRPPSVGPWLSHILQFLLIVVPIAVAAFVYWQNVQSQLAVQQSQITTIQADMIALHRELQQADEHRAAYETKMSEKLDTMAVQVGSIATDLSILRKEMHR